MLMKFLSPSLKEKNPQLKIFKYLNLKTTFMKDISLGGISNQNIKKL